MVADLKMIRSREPNIRGLEISVEIIRMNVVTDYRFIQKFVESKYRYEK